MPVLCRFRLLGTRTIQVLACSFRQKCERRWNESIGVPWSAGYPVRRLPDPELRTRNSAIVKVRQCSICGSDLHMYHGDTIGKTRYDSDTPTFCTGHEFIGEVVETGADVHRFSVGDAVLSAGGTGCGRSTACLTGRPLDCRHATAFGIGPGLQGGQAQYVCIPNADTTLLDTEGALTDEQALLLTDAMATAFFGITRADIHPGASVAVIGLGPIGLIGVELAFLLGASRVFAIDPVAGRRAMANRLGAIALDANSDSHATIMEATQGAGVPSVFEASGASAAIASVLPLTARGGTASFIGIPQPSDTLSMQQVLFKNITIRGGICPVPETCPHLMPLIREGRITAPDLFSHRFDLADGADAYRLFDSRDDGVVKIAIDVA
ncbi:MAG: alcohol dehydrogenase catalytic domain-containing protein [Pontixanthobacter sp.]